MEDGNGTVHAFDRDKLGRVVQDRVVTLGGGVDGAVRRVATAYDARRFMSAVTSYDDPAVGSGAVVNEVKLSYDSFGNLAEDAQSHSGSVAGGTPKVSHGYANGSANTARRTSMTYPGSAVLFYGYGAGGSADDRLSRLAEVTRQGETDAVAQFVWMGTARLVTLSYEEPGIELSYKKASGEPVGDAGDPYTGYDRFGRTVDMRWNHPSDSGELSRIQYGYDRISRRKWRQDLVASAATGQDNYWGYDGLGQVLQGTRGVLNINRTAVGGVPVEEQDFTYDPVGNWIGYERQVDDSIVLDQSRGYDRNNELLKIDGEAAGLSFDGAGNATQVKPDKSGDWINGYKLTWDAWNRIAAVRNSANDALVASYSYDGIYRRTMSTIDDEERHHYYNDGWKCIEERVGSATIPERVYIWSARPGHRDELVRRERDSSTGGTLNERLYCLMDYFDPVAVANVSGEIQERYAFTSFGLAQFMDEDFSERMASNFEWNFLFHGQFRDVETGWDNYGYRYYLPWLGRWLTRDPLGEKSSSNLYRMADNDLVMGFDLFGLGTITVPCGADTSFTGNLEKEAQKQLNGLRDVISECCESFGIGVRH